MAFDVVSGFACILDILDIILQELWILFFFYRRHLLRCIARAGWMCMFSFSLTTVMAKLGH